MATYIIKKKKIHCTISLSNQNIHESFGRHLTFEIILSFNLKVFNKNDPLLNSETKCLKITF